MPSSRAPRKSCIAFDKLDGSNFRAKYTQKKGFCLFGTRTQLIDINHPDFGIAVNTFLSVSGPAASLQKLIEKQWPNEREVVVFTEFFGNESFAGQHNKSDFTLRHVVLDIMIGHKNRKFLLPQEFIKICRDKVPIPDVIYQGNLNDQLILDVRSGKYKVNEGIVCKGTERTGAACGNVWMAKIKTQDYLNRVFNRFGQEGLEKYGE